MLIAIFIVFAYLFGSLNGAIIVCKLAKLADPREQGSGNAGATNVLRYGGKKLAALVMLIDLLKGVIPVVIARFVSIHGCSLSLIAAVTVLGHIYPIFFRFQGGKGIATTLGAILALSWTVGLIVILTWLIVAIVFQFSSLASLVSIILLPLYLLLWSNPQYILPMFLLTLIVIYRHRTNIQRLLKGEEPKIGKKKKSVKLL